MNAVPVTIPLLNPNEPEAMLAALHVEEGQQVQAGDALCTLETTKSAADVEAEQAGFVKGLCLQAGDTARAGEVLCYLAEQADWQPPAAPPAAPGEEAPAGLRITQPALALARKLGLDLEQLPPGRLITEKSLRQLAEDAAAPMPESAFDASAILVYGGGGHGKALLDLLRAIGTYRIAGVVDDNLPAGSQVMGFPVLGGKDVLPELHAQGVRLAVNAVGGIGNAKIRQTVFEILAQAGFVCPAIAHPSAVIELGAQISPGVQVMPLAYVGSDAKIGFGSIINTGVILSHDCVLGSLVNLSPGAILAGEVEVGARALIGMGVTVNLQVKIGAGARIGNGATVKADLPPNGVVRAGHIWPPAP